MEKPEKLWFLHLVLLLGQSLSFHYFATPTARFSLITVIFT
jgi:hypothetical protein